MSNVWANASKMVLAFFIIFYRMKFRLLYITVFLLSIIACSSTTKPTAYVDPFIGTGAHGHTYPGAQVPFGMVQLSPDTRNDESWDGCGGYHYSDSAILGFSHTHLSGTGVSDYGDILLLPITKNFTLESGTRQQPETGYRSRFSHENEQAEAGYYSVLLTDYDVQVELTASERIGYHRYTFQKASEVKLLLDLIHRDPVTESSLQVHNSNTIIGQRRSKYWAGDQHLFFAMELSVPFDSIVVYQNKKRINFNKQASGDSIQASICFPVSEEQVVEIKVALSAVSAENALLNLKEEASIDFDEAKRNAQNKWEKALGKIKVEGGSDKEKRNFYTALYHSMLAPNLYQDVDGRYRGMDGKVHQAKGFTNYTVFSLWDTFRALHPLLTIVEPKRANDFVAALVQKSVEHGELPMWEMASNDTRCMIGYHAVSLIADAHAKGINDFDLELAYQQMKRTAMSNKRGLKAYRSLGYVPSNKSSQAVSKTLEYAYNDWCVAQVAKALGKNSDYEHFMHRAMSYRNTYDASTGFMRGRTDSRKWVTPFDPTAVGYNYTEGNSYQYSLFVPHDPQGLQNLLGGKQSLETWLDKLFTTQMAYELEKDTDVTGLIGQYAHGNEPSHHMAFLYNNTNAPWKTQNIVREILATQYNDTPDGLCGNEDCGQMSAWYVFSAMGFYPYCSGTPYYSISSPIFDRIEIEVANGKKLTIVARNNSAKNKYIQSITWNGKAHRNTYFTHQQLLEGGELVFELGATPNREYFQTELPSISSTEAPSDAYLSNSNRSFLHQYTVDMRCDDPEAEIFFTTDGSTPSKHSQKYTKPFSITKTTNLRMRSQRTGKPLGRIISHELRKLESTDSAKKNKRQGVQYAYYEGIYRSVYDFAADTPKATGKSTIPTLDIRQRNEWYGMHFSTQLYIAKEGQYTFFVDANDGCQLRINDQELFESDGRKSFAFEQQATVFLTKGFHKADLLFYQCSHKQKLTWQWKGPDFGRENVPASVLFVP